MGIRLGSTVVNCADLETMTDFWTQALGLTPNHHEPGDDFRVLRGERVNMSLQVASTPVSARDQMHLDLYSDDPERRWRASSRSAPSSYGRTPATTTSSSSTLRATSSASAPSTRSDALVSL